MLSLQLMRQIAELFLIMLVGTAVVRLKIVKPEAVSHFSTVLVNTVIPCAIFKSFQIEYTASRLSGLLLAFGGAIIVHIVFLILTAVLRKPLQQKHLRHD